MKRILIHEHTAEIKPVERGIQSALPIVQDLLNEAKRLDLPVTNENFSNLIMDTEGFAQKEFTKQIPAESNGRFKKKKRVEDYEFPEISKLVFLAKKVRTVSPFGLAFYDVEDGTAKRNESEFQGLVNSMSVFLEGESKIHFYEKYKKMTDAMNEFNAYLKGPRKMAIGLTLQNVKSYIDLDTVGEFRPHLFMALEIAKTIK